MKALKKGSKSSFRYSNTLYMWKQFWDRNAWSMTERYKKIYLLKLLWLSSNIPCNSKVCGRLSSHGSSQNGTYVISWRDQLLPCKAGIDVKVCNRASFECFKTPLSCAYIPIFANRTNFFHFSYEQGSIRQRDSDESKIKPYQQSKTSPILIIFLKTWSHGISSRNSFDYFVAKFLMIFVSRWS